MRYYQDKTDKSRNLSVQLDIQLDNTLLDQTDTQIELILDYIDQKLNCNLLKSLHNRLYLTLQS